MIMQPKTLILTRVFDAPRELVFKVWTDPKHVANWWGPRGFDNPVCEWPAKPGGKINVTMRANEEIAAAIGMKEHPMGGEFREVMPPSNLVFTTTAFEAPDGSAMIRNLNTVTFEAQGGKTKVTLHVIVEHAAPEMAGALAGMEQGWSESLDKLAELLATSGDVFRLTRTVSAPRALVFKLWTERAHLEKWWGAPGMPIKVAKIELKPGGVFHYYMDTPGGKMWGKFVYREITPPERLVFVNSFSDEAGGITVHPMSPTWPKEVLSTIVFSESGGKTTMTLTGTPVNATDEERKTFSDNRENMNKGFGGTFDQLAAYLGTL